MEKTIYLLFVLALSLNLLNAQQLQLLNLNYPPKSPNALATITQLALDQNLPIEGIVLEGYLPLSDPEHLETLRQQLSLNDWSEAQEKALTPQTTLKLTFKQKNDQTVLTFQLISTNLAQAEDYYQIFQQFSYQAAGDTPVGVTILSEIDEPLEAKACQYLTDDLSHSLSASTIATTSEGNYQNIALYTPQITHSLTIAKEQVNLNIAFFSKEESTKIYIGSPIIYQQH